MKKESKEESFPREYMFWTDEEAKRVKVKISTPYTDPAGKRLYILPSSEDIKAMKEIQDKWEKHIVLDAQEGFAKSINDELNAKLMEIIGFNKEVANESAE